MHITLLDLDNISIARPFKLINASQLPIPFVLLLYLRVEFLDLFLCLVLFGSCNNGPRNLTIGFIVEQQTARTYGMCEYI